MRDSIERLITAPEVRDRRKGDAAGLPHTLAQMAWGGYDPYRFVIFGDEGDGTDLDGHAPHRPKYEGDAAVYHDADASDDLAWSLPPFTRSRSGKKRRAAPREKQLTKANGKSHSPSVLSDLDIMEVAERKEPGKEGEVQITTNMLADQVILIQVLTTTHCIDAWLEGDLKDGLRRIEDEVCGELLTLGFWVFLNGSRLIPLDGVSLIERTVLQAQERRIHHDHIVWVNTVSADTYEVITHTARYRICIPRGMRTLDTFCEQLRAAGFLVSLDRERYLPAAKRAERQAQLDRIAAATEGEAPQRIVVGGSRRPIGQRKARPPKAAEVE